MTKVVLKNEDALTVLKDIKSNSIGAVVTDPPYNIGFAGHEWDSNNPLLKIWKECFRTLKHGGYLVAFGDHKRSHHTIAELESIGFVLISGMAWMYPNGTPACQKIGDNHHARVKTSHETIGLFIKPIMEKTYKEQRAKHGNSGLRVSETVEGVKMTSSILHVKRGTILGHRNGCLMRL